MKLVVVQQGRLRDPRIAALRDEYCRRFAPHGRLQAVERAPKGDRTLWPASSAWRVAVDRSGEALTSLELADRVREWSERHGEIAFLIGEADGLHRASVAAADFVLSLGPLTLPHRLAHLILVEQLYRCAMILGNSSYHK